MSRIQSTFKRLKKEGRKALIPFITAGDPDLAETEKIVLTLEKAGADIIELGIPFSDPMADGPVIQLASERALKKGATLPKVLDLVKQLRRKTQVPLLLMGYYNPINFMGDAIFAKKAGEAGVDAVLVVDLPPEEAGPLHRELKKYKVDLVYLLAPTSTADRIQKVKKYGSGFIYYVSLTGVTGAQLKMNTEVGAQVARIQQQIKIPVCVGFGISKPDQAREVSKLADGVVVGSALVRLIAESPKKKLHGAVEKFIGSLRKAIDRP